MVTKLKNFQLWRHARLWAAIPVAYLALQTSVFAEYRLAAGDVVELSVAGFPDLRQKATIGVDGEIVLPLIGGLEAAGRTLTELSRTVRQAYSSTVIQQRVSGAQSEPVVISSNEITLQIAEYRPIYSNGDVSSPGQQLYRPGMTVRQAIAVAGGYSANRSGIANPRLEVVRLQGEIEALWAEQARDQAIAWRLNCELTGVDAPLPNLSMVPLSQSTVAQIIKTEEQQLKARRENLSKQRASIDRTIKQADKRLELLAQQLKNEEAGSQADAEDFARVNALFERGNVAAARLSDTRRTMLFSATRILQTSSAMSQLERERETLRRSLEEIEDKRRIEVNNELQQVNTRITQSQAKLAALTEQFQYVGGLRSTLMDSSSPQADLAIVRRSGSGVERIVANEDDQLQPGDVVEVFLRANNRLYPN